MRSIHHIALTTAAGLLLLAGCTAEQPEPETPVSTESTAGAEAAPAEPNADDYQVAGFAVSVKEGRLWVFREGSEHHAEFLRSGEPGKSVTLIGGGPDGLTIRGAEMETIEAYMAAR